MGLLRDDNGHALVLYHGTRAEFARVDTRHTIDRGLHFGDQGQARMRAGRSGRLIAANIDITSARRCRDDGGNWMARINQAKSAGHDAIVYLNRYEGVSLESIERAAAQGVDLDKLTDAQFRKLVPEARDSWIVFSTDQVRLLPGADIGPEPAVRKRGP